MPRLVLAALRGGAGKTILSLGLIAAFRERGWTVAPYKKGPDYIDAGWLAFAADRPCYNLDPFLMSPEQIVRSLAGNAAGAALALIEGNRGLFDGMDLQGRRSTAELAKIIHAPVILIVDVSMVTRTVAALVRGCQVFDTGLDLAGIILNRVAGVRQETLVRKAIEHYCELAVVGAVGKLQGHVFPERHMGLVPHRESAHAQRAVSLARQAATAGLDLDRILELAGRARPLPVAPCVPVCRTRETGTPRIGIIHDRAFWFYYPENLDQLTRLGAELIVLNALQDTRLPELDALYIGGGFPETQAEALAANRPFRQALRGAIDAGLPVYAECGGFMYLGRYLLMAGKRHPMVGALPVAFSLQRRPQGHGYTVLEVVSDNPFFDRGTRLKGHEFHYSRPIDLAEDHVRFAFRMRRGHGVDGHRDGLCVRNVLATYTHLHAAGSPSWAEGLYRAALAQKGRNRSQG